jgi:protease I
MELRGKRVIIFAEELYNEHELWYPYWRLKEAGADVKVVGPQKGKTHMSKTGMPVEVDLGSNEVSAKDFDGLVIPGGYAPDHMRRDPAMVRLVREFYEAGKPVAAICHAGWMLASADIVRGKTVTCFFAIKDDLIHAGANYVDQEVVVDGNLITSRKPEDLPAFMREFIKALSAQSR